MNTRKKQIVNSAYDLFIEKGYAATSIQDILDKAGISKGTFYNHFTSKGECLRAILELIVEELETRRIQAAAGKPADDPAVLSEQISIRMRLSKERNLFALYESIFYSEEAELKAFAKEQHLNELRWVAERIVDVYGKEARPFALESAALVLGTIQHLLHLIMTKAKGEISTDELTDFALRRMDASLKEQIRSNDSFLPFSLNELQTTQPPAIRTVRTRLQTLSEATKNEQTKQLAAFIATELEEETPRIHLIESLLASLEKDRSLDSELIEDIRKVLTT